MPLFFTGYGNQAPVTTSGRAMVSVFGFLSILAFGFILSSSGAILSVIVDDVISRCRLHVLLRPLVSLFLWGIVAGGWIMILGIITSNWWNSRYGVEEAPTKWWDSVWFAYISTTTVGLGDFFLFPEIMFYEDVFRFSILFLTSFVFMSTFLNGFVQALASLRADPSATLRNRIAKASSDRKPINIQKKRDKDMTNETGTTLEVLRELLCYELSDGHKGQRLATIVEEEELLRNLLERKSAERMQIELEGD